MMDGHLEGSANYNMACEQRDALIEKLRNELRSAAFGRHAYNPNHIIESFSKCHHSDCVRTRKLLGMAELPNDNLKGAQ